MSVFSYPMAAVYDTTGATAVLKVPPGGIPAGSVICVFVYGAFNSVGGGSGLSTQGIGDSAGNVYKFAFTPLDTSMWFLYTYNSKALRGGDTISVRKFGPAQVLGCAYLGLVTTKDPLTTAQMYDPVTTRPVTPAPPGDLVVAAVWSPAYGTGSLYIEDVTHPWNPNDFPTLKNYPGDLSDIPMFGTSLQPRPAGSFSWMPQIIPLPAGYGWVSITAGFTAAATTPLTSVGFTVGSPALVPGSFSIFGKVVPIGITTASPVIEAPSTGVEAPAVVCLTHRDDPDIQEALFTNTNIALGLEVQPHSLVGRSSDGVGMAERIPASSAPLLLVDKLFGTRSVIQRG